MDDYISREAAIKALGDKPEVWNDTPEEYAYRFQYFIDLDAIKNVPPADVRPVVRGKWEKRIVEDENDPYGLFRKRFYCSSCGEWQTYGMTNFCPACGSRNSEESDDHQ